METIGKAEDVMKMVREISEKTVESEDEGDESEDGEGEVVALARRCLEISSGETAPANSKTDSQPSSYKA